MSQYPNIDFESLQLIAKEAPNTYLKFCDWWEWFKKSEGVTGMFQDLPMAFQMGALLQFDVDIYDGKMIFNEGMEHWRQEIEWYFKSKEEI